MPSARTCKATDRRITSRHRDAPTCRLEIGIASMSICGVAESSFERALRGTKHVVGRRLSGRFRVVPAPRDDRPETQSVVQPSAQLFEYDAGERCRMLATRSTFRNSDRIRSAAAAARSLVFSVGSTTAFSASAATAAYSALRRDSAEPAAAFSRAPRNFVRAICAAYSAFFTSSRICSAAHCDASRKTARHASTLRAPIATPGGSPGPRPRQHLRSPLSRRVAPVRPIPAVERPSMGRSARRSGTEARWVLHGASWSGHVDLLYSTLRVRGVEAAIDSPRVGDPSISSEPRARPRRLSRRKQAWPFPTKRYPLDPQRAGREPSPFERPTPLRCPRRAGRRRDGNAFPSR